MRSLLLLALLAGPVHASSGGKYFEVSYPPSTKEGELRFGVTFTVWVPDTKARLRGVIVHQHGCGAGACKAGKDAAYDLHWQALAKKWDCALLGPSYDQPDKENCRLWCDPRNGSGKTFLRALADLGKKAGRAELETVPWCLWGHSGGGFWASLMQTEHPERIVAIWLRSGTAFSAWESGQIKKPTIPEAAYQVPVMCNPGALEKDDKRFKTAWTGSESMFRAYRAKGAPIGFAPEPKCGHECGVSRFLAIPYFDACLAQRLPEKGAKDQKLRPVDASQAQLGEFLGHKFAPAKDYKGDTKTSVWLPDKSIATLWQTYVLFRSATDQTPPPAPTNVKLKVLPDGGVELTWTAEAAVRGGLRNFFIKRGDLNLTTVPFRLDGQVNFQGISYHDTPKVRHPEMRHVDRYQRRDLPKEYRIYATNGAGQWSAASVTVKVDGK